MSSKYMKQAVALSSSLLLAATLAAPAAVAAPGSSDEVSTAGTQPASAQPHLSHYQRHILDKLEQEGMFTEASSERVRVLVMLKSQPSDPSAKGERRNLQNQEDLLAGWQADYGFTVDRQFGYLINGVSGEMPANKMAELAADPNVDSVRKERVYYRSEHTARNLHKVPEAFKAHGVDGEGTVISIIDSGVDPAHPDMRLDDGVKPKLATAEGSSLFTSKVPNGYNYADRSFEIRDLTASQHGQHVAGIVAANGSEGAEPDFAQSGRIDGAAPNAQLLAMKVFSNNAGYSGGALDGDIIAAIEDSVKMGADVINMSLGSDNGLLDESDGTSFAIEAAREQGVLTLVAAGNAGQNFSLTGGPDDALGRFDDGIVGWPSTQQGAFAVASMENSASTLPLARYGTEGNLTDVFFSPHTGTPDGQLHDVRYVGLGRAEDYPAGFNFNGAYALIQRGEISFADKFQFAIDHGAGGVIIFNHVAGGDAAPGMAGVDHFKVFGASMGHSDGMAIVNALRSNPDTKVQFTNQVGSRESGAGLTPSSFTSWGTTPTLDFAPQIAGIGGNVYSTVGADGYGTKSGTSMATPNLAGLSALVFQKHGGKIAGSERVDHAKTVLMNTAQIPTNDAGVPFSPRQIGAGLAQVDKALDTPVTATVDGKPSVALREVNETRTFTVTLTNHENEPASYKIPAQQVISETNEAQSATTTYVGGGTLTASQDSVTVPAGGSATVDFVLSPDTTFAHFIQGWAQFEGEGVPNLVVPYLGFVGDWNAENIVQDPYVPWAPGAGNDVTHVAAPLANRGNLALNGTRLGEFAISPNGDGLLDSAIPQMLLMRNADAAEYEILDSTGKVVVQVGRDENLRRVSGVDVVGAEFAGQLLTSGRAFNGRQWDTQEATYDALADGEYTFRIKTRLGDSWQWQNTDIAFKVDTTAPEIEILDSSETSVHFRVSDAQSGIFSEPSVFTPAGEEISVVALPDGSFRATFDASLDYVSVEVLDRGLNAGSYYVSAKPGYLGVNAGGIQTADGEHVWVAGIWNQREVLPIQGVVSPEITRVRVNGEDVEVASGGYAHVISNFTQTKDFAVTVEGFDKDGGLVTSKSFTVSVDLEAPSVEFTGGVIDGQAVVGDDGFAHLKGRVTDDREGATLAMSVNNTPVKLAADGSFDVRIPVRGSDTSLVVVTSDGLNQRSQVVPIQGRFAFQSSSVVQILKPGCSMPYGMCYVNSDSESVSKTENGHVVTIEGTVAPSVTSLEFFTGSRAADNGVHTGETPIKVERNNDGTFKAYLPAETGINTVRVIAKGERGVLLDRGYAVFFDVEPPQVSFDEPTLYGGTLFTNKDEVLFRGTISDNGWGHSLFINNSWVTDFRRSNNPGADVNKKDFEQIVAVRHGDQILLRSNDTMGNQIVGVIPVVVDKKNPTAGVETVSDGEVIEDQRTLEAWAEDENLARTRITLNGETILDEQATLVQQGIAVEDVLVSPNGAGSNAGGRDSGAEAEEASASDAGGAEVRESENSAGASDTEPGVGSGGTQSSVANTRMAVKIDTSTLAAGQYTVAVESVDLAGNVTSESTVFHVDAPAVIEGPDSVEIEVKRPELKDQKALAAHVLAHYSVSDDGSHLAEGETVLGLAEGTVLVPGSQKVTLVATDASGKQVSKVVTVTITVVDSDNSDDGTDPDKGKDPEKDDKGPRQPPGTGDDKPQDKGGKHGKGGKSGQGGVGTLPRTGVDPTVTAMLAALLTAIGAGTVFLARRGRVQ